MAKYYGVTRSPEYLAHYGIPGMRRGIRRSQDELDALAGRANNQAIQRAHDTRRANQTVVKTQAVKVQKSTNPQMANGNSGLKPIGLSQTRAYNRAVEKLQQLQAEAPAELAKERPIVDREEALKGKVGKRKRNAANNVSYKQRKSDEAYYANRNKYVTPKFSRR